MSIASHAARAPAKGVRAPLFLRLAWRELRGGMSGFNVFVACIALGVAAIAGIGSLAQSLQAGIERQGREILGGDVSLSLVHRRAPSEQRAFFDRSGTVSETASLRAMARPAQGGDPTLVQLKAVDSTYPLYGRTRLSANGEPVALDRLQTQRAAAVEPLLLDRLGLKIGDHLRIGGADLTIVAQIDAEPDRLSAGLEFGPHVLLSHASLEATGLIQPGSLMRWAYHLRLPDADIDALKAFRASVNERFKEAGFTIRDRSDPSPRLRRAIDRFAQFLTLIGITTLMIGGIGVANAIAAYLAKKRDVIVAFKCLGATNGTIFATYLAQIVLLACVGIAAGLLIGAAVPALAMLFYGSSLPVDLTLRPSWGSLALASLYGLLTALLFALWPLGVARELRPALLLRRDVSGEEARPGRSIMALCALNALAIVAVAVATSDRQLLSLYAALGLAGAFIVFLIVGWAIERLARNLPRPRSATLALGIANLSGPGNLSRPVALSLGASLSLLAATALVDHSLIAELSSRLPAQAPTFYLIDVQKERAQDLQRIVRSVSPEARLDTAPMLRGRIVRIKDVSADEVKPPENIAWVLNGDRGLTYSPALPEGSTLSDGEWWAPDYQGRPLVSFEAEIARGLGLQVGDNVTVNVLGRDIEARIANLRDLDWESLSINFVMVFSPNTLASAPSNLLATVMLPKDEGRAVEAQLMREVASAMPAVTAVRVRDALQSFQTALDQVMTAIRSASALTLLTGAIVLAGALATAQRRRMRDAVIFKTLGATRGRILSAHLFEYAVLALVTGLVAFGVGTLAAYLVLKLAMKAEFTFSLGAVAQAIGFAALLVFAVGAAGTWRVLSVRPARHLREG